MPLPDADKKSPRVYTLSQNTDLENMAFATLQSIGQPINIEEMNEDELRRLVLVNLARLAVKGEWSGLLEAGGGEFNAVLLEDVISTGYVRYVVNAYPPYGSSTTTSQNFSTSTTQDRCFFWPFLAPESGDIAEIGIEIIVASTTSNDIQVGVYSSTATTGAPDTLLGKAVLDSQSTGAVYDTSLYYPAFSPWNAPNINGKGGTIRLSGSDLSLPTGSITLTNFEPTDFDNPCISMKIT